MGEVDMEQEEQAPAVGVLKNENVRARGQRRKQKDPFKYLNRANLILFFSCVLFHASLKKLQKVNTLKIKALFINPAYQIVRMKIIHG